MDGHMKFEIKSFPSGRLSGTSRCSWNFFTENLVSTLQRISSFGILTKRTVDCTGEVLRASNDKFIYTW